MSAGATTINVTNLSQLQYQPGDTVLFWPGGSMQTNGFSLTNSGTSGNSITFKGAGGFRFIAPTFSVVNAPLVGGLPTIINNGNASWINYYNLWFQCTSNSVSQGVASNNIIAISLSLAKHINIAFCTTTNLNRRVPDSDDQLRICEGFDVANCSDSLIISNYLSWCDSGIPVTIGSGILSSNVTLAWNEGTSMNHPWSIGCSGANSDSNSMLLFYTFTNNWTHALAPAYSETHVGGYANHLNAHGINFVGNNNASVCFSNATLAYNKFGPGFSTRTETNNTTSVFELQGVPENWKGMRVFNNVVILQYPDLFNNPIFDCASLQDGCIIQNTTVSWANGALGAGIAVGQMGQSRCAIENNLFYSLATGMANGQQTGWSQQFTNVDYNCYYYVNPSASGAFQAWRPSSSSVIQMAFSDWTNGLGNQMVTNVFLDIHSNTNHPSIDTTTGELLANDIVAYKKGNPTIAALYGITDDYLKIAASGSMGAFQITNAIPVIGKYYIGQRIRINQ